MCICFSILPTRFLKQILPFLVSVGTLHRELQKLTASGILKSRKIGKIKLFSLNKQNPIYDEIKNIIYKTEG
jgi:DNA-binding transcriptional ArsR family regulator